MWLVKTRRSYLVVALIVAGCYLISRTSDLFTSKPSLLVLRGELVIRQATEASRNFKALSKTVQKTEPRKWTERPTVLSRVASEESLPKIAPKDPEESPRDSGTVLSEAWKQSNQRSNPGSLPEVRSRNRPVALSLNYWEQTANALVNLFDLQCWAGTVNISGVVEPSILRDWGRGVFQTLSPEHSQLTFRDLFDLNQWNSMSAKYGVSPLVSLEDFLENASRDVVYVQITYHRLEHENEQHCRQLDSVTRDSWAQLLQSKGFHVAKTVCIDFSMNASISEEEFREKIFAGIDHPVSVLFNRFRGISPLGKGARLVMTGPLSEICARMLKNFDTSTHQVASVRYTPLNSSSQIVPSRRILEHVKQFISEKLVGERYIAVMLRTERLKNLLPNRTQRNNCVSNIISDWEEIVARNDIHKTLFFSDIGNHGSLGWENNQEAIRFTRRVQGAINLELSPNDVNTIIEEMTGSKGSVQMAVLHQQLVAHATCVVVVGGGRFQSQTLNMYFHSHRQQECYAYRDGLCNPSYISQVYGF